MKSLAVHSNNFNQNDQQNQRRIVKRQLIGPAAADGSTGSIQLGLSVTAKRLRASPPSQSQSAPLVVAPIGRSMAELLPIGGGGGPSSSASGSGSGGGGGVGKTALDMLCAMASSCGYERHYHYEQGTTATREGQQQQQQQQTSNRPSTAAPPLLLDPFEAYVYDTLYSNKGAVMARVAEALLVGADVVVRCPSAPRAALGDADDAGQLVPLPPLISFARDSVMTDLPALPAHQPATTAAAAAVAASAVPPIAAAVGESAADSNVVEPIPPTEDDYDDLFFPTDAPTPTTPAPPPLPLAPAVAATAPAVAVVPPPSSSSSSPPPPPHAALSLLPQLYVGALWPFVLHVASQPLLDYRQGPLGLIIGASQQQCAELHALIGPLAEQLQLVVHNVFGPLPLMPEARRADIVIGTAARIASGVIPTNGNGGGNGAVEKVAERYYPTSCHFPSLPPTAAAAQHGGGAGAHSQAQALLAYEYYTLAHCSQLLIFEEDGGSSSSSGLTSSAEGKGGASAAAASTPSLERAALERIVGSTHYSGSGGGGGAALSRYGGRNKGVLPTCQITLITNRRADDDDDGDGASPSSASLFGLAALHYRKSEVAAALSLQGCGGEGGEVVVLDLSLESAHHSSAAPAATVAGTAAADSPSPSPSRPSLLGQKRARSSLLTTATTGAGGEDGEARRDDDDEGQQPSVYRRIGLTVHNVTTPSRWEQLGAGAGAEPSSLHPALAHLKRLVLVQWGEQCLKGSGVAVSLVASGGGPPIASSLSYASDGGGAFGRFYGADGTVGVKCSVVVRTDSTAAASGHRAGAGGLPPLPLLLASLCQCIDGASLEPGGDAMRFIMVAEAQCGGVGGTDGHYHCSHKLPLDFVGRTRGGGDEAVWRCLGQQKGPIVPRFPFVGDVLPSPHRPPSLSSLAPRFAVMIRGFVPPLRMVLDLGDDAHCCAAGGTTNGDASGATAPAAAARARRLVERPLAELLSRLLLSSSSPLTPAEGTHAAVDSTAHVIISAMLGALVGGASARLPYPSSSSSSPLPTNSCGPSVINASLIYSLAAEQQQHGDADDADGGDLAHLIGGGEARFLVSTALCVQVPSWQSAVVLASQLGGGGGAPPPIPVGPSDAGVRTYFALMQQMGIAEGRQLHYYAEAEAEAEAEGQQQVGGGTAHFTLASAVAPAVWAQQQGMVCAPMLI